MNSSAWSLAAAVGTPHSADEGHGKRKGLLMALVSSLENVRFIDQARRKSNLILKSRRTRDLWRRRAGGRTALRLRARGLPGGRPRAPGGAADQPEPAQRGALRPDGGPLPGPPERRAQLRPAARRVLRGLQHLPPGRGAAGRPVRLPRGPPLPLHGRLLPAHPPPRGLLEQGAAAVLVLPAQRAPAGPGGPGLAPPARPCACRHRCAPTPPARLPLSPAASRPRGPQTWRPCPPPTAPSTPLLELALGQKLTGAQRVVPPCPVLQPGGHSPGHPQEERAVWGRGGQSSGGASLPLDSWNPGGSGHRDGPVVSSRKSRGPCTGLCYPPARPPGLLPAPTQRAPCACDPFSIKGPLLPLPVQRVRVVPCWPGRAAPARLCAPFPQL
ncbi:PREDICTED: basic proline-rich protein-like [Condylura cristata]|uniref:basic proline-rich protein-like n=1 Tax=Condylura cristata TaxID=143302 RepID=UPI000643DD0C|nr:PREDICTED: basic proline-rich protein-like [Condylura cristata]